MKLLIWGVCIFGAAAINVLLGYIAGFRVGYGILYLVIWWVAKTLCKKWDHRKALHKEIETDTECEVSSLNTTDDASCAVDNVADTICFCRKCGEKLLADSSFCRKCGTRIMR